MMKNSKKLVSRKSAENCKHVTSGDVTGTVLPLPRQRDQADHSLYFAPVLQSFRSMLRFPRRFTDNKRNLVITSANRTKKLVSSTITFRPSHITDHEIEYISAKDPQVTFNIIRNLSGYDVSRLQQYSLNRIVSNPQCMFNFHRISVGRHSSFPSFV